MTVAPTAKPGYTVQYMCGHVCVRARPGCCCCCWRWCLPGLMLSGNFPSCPIYFFSFPQLNISPGGQNNKQSSERCPQCKYTVKSPSSSHHKVFVALCRSDKRILWKKKHFKDPRKKKQTNKVPQKNYIYDMKKSFIFHISSPVLLQHQQ